VLSQAASLANGTRPELELRESGGGQEANVDHWS